MAKAAECLDIRVDASYACANANCAWATRMRYTYITKRDIVYVVEQNVLYPKWK